ncbi:MAG: hypothetical protein VX061_01835 [Pseudomonadota bacterium]|nr:hypothetical protein [Pseudomonadota bacterium]
MDKNKFDAHGEVKARFNSSQHILYIDLIGPFNLEFMHKYEVVVGAQRAKIDVPCWGSVVNVNGLALAPMAATNSGQLIVDKAVAQGLVATAIVFHETEGAELQRKFWSRVYETSSLPFAFFPTTKEATDWLSEKILSCLQTKRLDHSMRVN